jgi:hypothetical protein
MKEDLVLVVLSKQLVEKVREAPPNSMEAARSQQELVAAVLKGGTVSLAALLGPSHDLSLTEQKERAENVARAAEYDALSVAEADEAFQRGFCLRTYPFACPADTSFEKSHYVCTLAAGHVEGCVWSLPESRPAYPSRNIKKELR